MTDAVAHRGPDSEGHLLEGQVALGHRRLSVLDLSEHGNQPMSYSNTGLTLIYNGEIYNYVEIRAELKAVGYSFTSDTDSEVILAAYDRWGAGCVTRFNGMWSFAMLDRRRNVLFCSRDRFGVKPFYYVDRPNIFAFGSEIRQLLPFLEQRKANLDVVRTYLVTDASELSDATFFENVRRLPGGHNGIYNLSTNRFAVERFYELSPRDEFGSLSPDQATERFADLFDDAVRLRLRSDVRVGTCLSGGLDSSSVATIASALYRKSSRAAFSAITAVSEQESTNEAEFARKVVDASGLDWIQVRPSYRDFVDSLPKIVETQEEPYGSPSVTMQYFVMKAARDNGITVLLDGQGGDETLLGYEKYYAAYVASSVRREGVGAALAALRSISRNNAKMGPVNIAKYLIGGMVAPMRYSFYKGRHGYLRRHAPIPPHLEQFSQFCFDSFNLQKLEITSTNLPILLRYEDKNSMAHAIEARLPFLDYRLVELNLSLPDTLKIRDGWTKWILRRAMNDRMPRDIVWRKNKFGFEAPDDLWLKTHGAEMARAVQASPMLDELADMAKLKSAYGRLDKRSRWRLYSLALWEDQFKVD
jgi:asparagine synthase (glutamine-hydrolysing)